MKALKQTVTALLTLTLLLGLTACGSTHSGTTATEEEPVNTENTTAVTSEEAIPADEVTIRAAAMTGPTGMGLAMLLDQFGAVETMQEAPLVEETSANGGSYNFLLAGTADEITPLLMKGELDVACVPANLASVLYNKTEGGIVTLGVNTLGVLYIVDKDGSIRSLEDLKGKTMVSAGKGSVPEYGLRYVLQENGIDPDKDLTIEWKSEQSECVAALASGMADIAMMPQPYVTVAQNKIEGLGIAIDLTEEWDKLDNGSAMITGVVVARKTFVEEHPIAVENFLKDYAQSVAWIHENTQAAAEVIGSFGIVDAAIAEQALPYCNIVCITGSEMQVMLSGYLTALAELEASAIGGTVPGDDFYYLG